MRKSVQESGYIFSFEYCYWKHNGRLCEFEWKYNAGAVKKQSCNDLNARIEFIGDYKAHQCQIKLSNVSPDDTGTWMCDIESYVFGVARGYQAKATVDLIVKVAETTTKTSINSTTTSNEVLETNTRIVEEASTVPSHHGILEAPTTTSEASEITTSTACKLFAYELV